MMNPIDPLHMAVDLAACAEIAGAEAVDLETNQVAIREITYSGEVRQTIHAPAGVRIVRRDIAKRAAAARRR